MSIAGASKSHARRRFDVDEGRFELHERMMMRRSERFEARRRRFFDLDEKYFSSRRRVDASRDDAIDRDERRLLACEKTFVFKVFFDVFKTRSPHRVITRSSRFDHARRLRSRMNLRNFRIIEAQVEFFPITYTLNETSRRAGWCEIWSSTLFHGERRWLRRRLRRRRPRRRPPRRRPPRSKANVSPRALSSRRTVKPEPESSRLARSRAAARRSSRPMRLSGQARIKMQGAELCSAPCCFSPSPPRRGVAIMPE